MEVSLPLLGFSWYGLNSGCFGGGGGGVVRGIGLGSQVDICGGGLVSVAGRLF